MLKANQKQLKIIALIRLMKQVESPIAQCSRCGICQSVCPLYKITQNESDVARGKLMLLDGLIRSFFKDPAGVSHRMNRCLLCGSCAANCPRGVPVLEIFFRTRILMTGYMGLSFIKKIIFRGLLSNPPFFDRIVSWGAKWQSLFFKNTRTDKKNSCAEPVSLLLSNRHLVPLAPVPFHSIRLYRKISQAAPKKGSRIKAAFFVGCLLDKVFPKVAEDVIRVLHFHNVQVILPPTQGCCGIPALSSGDDATFNKLIAYNLNCFDPKQFDYLVTACATCTATIKKIWPAFFHSASEEQAQSLDQIVRKTYDISQFLTDIIGVPESIKPEGGKKTPCTVSYHDPCHLKKTLNVYVAPRQLIQSCENVSFREMTDADSCCGMGGSFNLSHYSLSAEIGQKKVRNIQDTGASIVATGCPACMIQLRDMLARHPPGIRVAHTLEIYAENFLPPHRDHRV